MQRDRTSSLSPNRALFILGSAVAALVMQACSSGNPAAGDAGGGGRGGAGGGDAGRDAGVADTSAAGTDGGTDALADTSGGGPDAASDDGGAAGAPPSDAGNDALPSADALSSDATTADGAAGRTGTSLIRFTATVAVPGTANLMGAGHTTLPPDPTGPGHEGIFPTLLQLPAGTGRSMTLTNPMGLIKIDAAGSLPYFGADGFVYTASPVGGPAVGGLAAPTTDRHAFLAGVFLGAAEPAAPAPPAFVVNATASTISGVTLAQIFFIGDGMDGAVFGTGDVQTIRIPDGATRLFLGFLEIDYADNLGAVSATVTVSGVAAP